MSTNEKNKEKSFYLYRVISFQRLVDILVNKKNTLVNPSKWVDPFEGWILNNKQSNKKSECIFLISAGLRKINQKRFGGSTRTKRMVSGFGLPSISCGIRWKKFQIEKTCFVKLGRLNI